MVVKRIEHKKDKYGPFYGRSNFGSRLSTWEMPTPSRDGIGWDFPDGYLFAFPDNVTMDRWVKHDDRILLAIYGFVLRTYEIKDYKVGFNQVCFNPATASVISEERLY